MRPKRLPNGGVSGKVLVAMVLTALGLAQQQHACGVLLKRAGLLTELQRLKIANDLLNSVDKT